jgi:hypothetical protein
MEETINKEKNRYWDLTVFEEDQNPEIDEFIFTNRGKIKINLHNHSCMNKKYPKFEIGKYYYIDCSHTILEPSNYKLCLITEIRSGVIFYTIEDQEKEHHFEEFCLQHYFAEPEEIIINLNPKHYEIISRSGKMRITYAK